MQRLSSQIRPVLLVRQSASGVELLLPSVRLPRARAWRCESRQSLRPVPRYFSTPQSPEQQQQPSAPDTEAKKDVDAKAEAASPTSSTEAPSTEVASSAGDAAQSKEDPNVLWRAQPFDETFKQADWMLTGCSAGFGVGVGIAMLGIAPFLDPNPYMIGLLLAIFQVRLGHGWASQTLTAHAQRYVERMEVLPASTENSPRLKIQCALGLTRTVYLVPASTTVDRMPSFKELLEKATIFISMEEKARIGGDAEKLKELLSRDLVIEKEEMKRANDDSSVPQQLSELNKDKLEEVMAKLTLPVPGVKESIDEVISRSQTLGAVGLLGGCMIFFGAKIQLWKPIPGALPLLDR